MKFFNSKGQIWVETVVYTLIGLSLIGLVLAIITPQINEYKDRIIIEQTIESLGIFDSKVSEVLQAPGNKRKIEMKLKRGDFYIDTQNNKIRFELSDSRTEYSEPDVPIKIGRIEITTTELTKRYKISLEISYNYDITFTGHETSEAKFTQASTPYNFFIENKGFINGNINIDISEE